MATKKKNKYVGFSGITSAQVESTTAAAKKRRLKKTEDNFAKKFKDVNAVNKELDNITKLEKRLGVKLKKVPKFSVAPNWSPPSSKTKTKTKKSGGVLNVNKKKNRRKGQSGRQSIFKGKK